MATSQRYLAGEQRAVERVLNDLSEPARARFGYDAATDHPQVRALARGHAELCARLRAHPSVSRERVLNNVQELSAPGSTAPVPSCAVVCVDAADTVPLRHLARGFRFRPVARPDAPERAIEFRTVYDTDVRPVAVAAARAGAPARGTGLPRAATEAGTVLRVTVETTHRDGFAGLTGFDRLRLHFAGRDGDPVPYQLYEAIFGDLVGAWVRDGAREEWFPCAAERVGVRKGEDLFDYTPAVFRGERLVRDLFAYHPKFLFADLTRLAPAARAAGGTIEVLFAFKLAWPSLSTALEVAHLRTNAVPVVNLFTEDVALVAGEESSSAAVRSQLTRGAEVYAVRGVAAQDGAAGATPVPNWLPGRPWAWAGAAGRRWVTERGTGSPEGRKRVTLALLDPAAGPLPAGATALSVTAEFTNGPAPAARAPRHFQAIADEKLTATAVRPPTATLRVPVEGTHQPAAITALALNALTLHDGATGARMLSGLLAPFALLNAVPDPVADPAEVGRKALADGLLTGLKRVQAVPDVVRLTRPPFASVPALHYEIDLGDAPALPGTGFLFAAVLEAALGHTAEFDRPVRTTATTPRVTRSWPAKISETTV